MERVCLVYPSLLGEQYAHQLSYYLIVTLHVLWNHVEGLWECDL